MEEELRIEGELKLRKDGGGWRHYLKDGENDRDIKCGECIVARLSGDALGLDLDGWLPGRYEARLVEPVEAYLVGDFHPILDVEQVVMPLGTMVRVR